MANALERISNQWDKDVIMPLREQMIGRQLIPKNPTLSGKGIGLESVDYYTFGDLSAGLVDYSLPDDIGDQDTVDLTSTTLKMLYMSKSFKIKRTAYEAYLMKGIPIDNSAALAIADLVAIEENKVFIDGWKPDGTNYLIRGLYNAPTGVNSEATADDFGTYGNAMNKVSLAIGEMLTDSVLPPYNLTLHPTQYSELVGSVSTTGASEWDAVMKMLNPTGGNTGQIRMSTALTAATGLLTGIGSKYFDFVEGQIPKYQLTFDSKMGDLSPVFGLLYEAVVPRIKHPQAVCKLTNI